MVAIGRVLVVDDDRDIVESVSIRLRAAGYEVLVAYDGQQGVAMAVAHEPDAIVLDVRMPKMDGMTALSTLRQHRVTKDIPVIMLSASLYDQQGPLLAGASFFVVKPYSPHLLLAALESAIHDGVPEASVPSAPGQVSATARVTLNDSNSLTATINSIQRTL